MVGVKSVNQPKDLEPLIEQIKDRQIVMLGEATHGTREFYDLRRMISEWLIAKHGFNFIAVEGDWPACAHVHRYIVRGENDSAREVLGAFHRWPTWMWANTEVIRLVEWLRSHNAGIEESRNRVGFHGLDVYSLFESMDEVLTELKKINPFLARRAQARYACFDPFNRNEKAYLKSLFEHSESCEAEVVQVLEELLKLRLEQSPMLDEIRFNLEQNARIARNAEDYYRAIVRADEQSWNVRDHHMLETLSVLLDHYGPASKALVWAHNSHVGDYRATSMAREGLINLGGIARDHFGRDQVALDGFGTYAGTVTASPAWDGPTETLEIPKAKAGSTEAIFHELALKKKSNTLLAQFDESQLPESRSLRSFWSETRGHRAVGVVYHPRSEHWNGYVSTQLARRYDAFLFVDQTHALEPLISGFRGSDLPETWPAGV